MESGQSASYCQKHWCRSKEICIVFCNETTVEAFDEGEEDEIEEKSKKRKTANIVLESLERRLSLRLDALASWMAHALAD